jgi:hypothetical protein
MPADVQERIFDGSWTPGECKLRTFIARLDQEGTAQTSRCSDPGAQMCGCIVRQPKPTLACCCMLAGPSLKDARGLRRLVGAVER